MVGPSPNATETQQNGNGPCKQGQVIGFQYVDINARKLRPANETTQGSGRASENMSLGYIRNKRKRSSIKQLMELCKPNGDHVVEQTTG